MKTLPETTGQTVERILGRLRRRAARYRGDSTEAGDELVVLTLKTAILEEASRPTDLTLQQWLHRIMKRHLN